MPHFAPLAAGALALGLAVTASVDWSVEETSPTAAVERVELAPPAPGPMSSRYSPFAIRLSGHTWFDVVTFKDVSQKRSDPELQIDEQIAEAVSLALRGTHPSVMTEVIHEPRLTKAESHVFCDQRHLYVDYWQTGVPGRWGYSLWSGCGEDDRFAWQEVAGQAASDLGQQIDLVTQQISETLAAADAKACHQREC